MPSLAGLAQGLLIGTLALGTVALIGYIVGEQKPVPKQKKGGRRGGRLVADDDDDAEFVMVMTEMEKQFKTGDIKTASLIAEQIITGTQANLKFFAGFFQLYKNYATPADFVPIMEAAAKFVSPTRSDELAVALNNICEQILPSIGDTAVAERLIRLWNHVLKETGASLENLLATYYLLAEVCFAQKKFSQAEQAARTAVGQYKDASQRDQIYFKLRYLLVEAIHKGVSGSAAVKEELKEQIKLYKSAKPELLPELKALVQAAHRWGPTYHDEAEQLASVLRSFAERDSKKIQDLALADALLAAVHMQKGQGAEAQQRVNKIKEYLKDATFFSFGHFFHKDVTHGESDTTISLVAISPIPRGTSIDFEFENPQEGSAPIKVTHVLGENPSFRITAPLTYPKSPARNYSVQVTINNDVNRPASYYAFIPTGKSSYTNEANPPPTRATAPSATAAASSTAPTDAAAAVPPAHASANGNGSVPYKVATSSRSSRLPGAKAPRAAGSRPKGKAAFPIPPGVDPDDIKNMEDFLYSLSPQDLKAMVDAKILPPEILSTPLPPRTNGKKVRIVDEHGHDEEIDEDELEDLDEDGEDEGEEGEDDEEEEDEEGDEDNEFDE